MTCKPPLNDFADIIRVGPQLSPPIRCVLSLSPTGEPISKDPLSHSWKPLQFEDAEHYVHTACIEWRAHFWLGTMSGRHVLATTDGYVRCQETNDNLSGQLDLGGYGKLEWDLGSMEFFVLGHVFGFGTALLLDKSGNVWLYNHYDALDVPYEGFKQLTAAICLPAGSIAEKATEILLTNIITQPVKVVLYKDDDEY
jgi:hypothetical protein